MEKLDILHRDEFVCQLLKLTENLSSNKSSACFAINGAWGCGKTFVLDMFQEQLEQIQSVETYTEKFLVIRYNCWKFDYYEEPLVAIVSSMMSMIEEKTKLFPDNERKHEILGMLKAIGVSLLSIGADAVKEKTGFDCQKAYETVKSGNEKGASEYDAEHSYDVYFSFNKVLSELSNLLHSLAEQYTIVFLVDELDRCLPEYAIKILERLHHLTEGQSNIITVISIDKNQLLCQVKNIFGFENPEKYLEKFINFEVKLDNGKVSEKLTEKYADYIALFDKDILPFDEPFEECLQELLKNINSRTQEQLMRKVMLAHQLLYADKKDYSFMCMEVLLAVMICVYHDDSCFTDETVDLSSFDRVFVTARKKPQPEFAEFFQRKFEAIHFSTWQGFPEVPEKIVLPDKPNLYGAMLFTWYWMHETSKNVVISYKQGSVYTTISKNHEELMKFAETIKMMS